MRRAYRADAAAAAPAAPAAPSLGYPSLGDPGNNVEPTLLGAYYVHMLTEAIVTVIERAGMTPNDQPTQFRDAVLSLIPGGADLSTYATRVWVETQINNLLDSAPGALNTLNELAAALGDDANFAATVNAALTARVLKAGDTMTGPLVLADVAAGANNNHAVYASWVRTRIREEAGMQTLFGGLVEVPELPDTDPIAGHATVVLSEDVADYSVIQVLGFVRTAIPENISIAWLPISVAQIPQAHAAPQFAMAQQGISSGTDTIPQSPLIPRIWRSGARTLRFYADSNSDRPAEDMYVTTVLGLARA